MLRCSCKRSKRAKKTFDAKKWGGFEQTLSLDPEKKGLKYPDSDPNDAPETEAREFRTSAGGARE